MRLAHDEHRVEQNIEQVVVLFSIRNSIKVQLEFQKIIIFWDSFETGKFCEAHY